MKGIKNMLQGIINYVYRYPKSNWRTIRRFGGYQSYRKMISGKKQMIRACKYLPPILSHANGLPVYFLTGKKHVYQTLFCAYSLAESSKSKFQFVLVDDGSFDRNLTNELKKRMPNVKLVLKKEIEENLALKLPLDTYPYLHYKRKVYPHIKKLTDIHTLAADPFKLVLDSDMLFWNEPAELIDWLMEPKGTIFMLDSEESYGYSLPLMESLCLGKLPRMMNVGAFGLESQTINWSQLELWSKSLETREGPSYFLEQALSAMLVSSQDQTILNKTQYIVNPPETIDNLEATKLHHYVDLSKQFYFNTAWQLLMKKTSD